MTPAEYFKLSKKRAIEIMIEITDYFNENYSCGIKLFDLVRFSDLKYKKKNENRFALHFCGYIRGYACKGETK